MRFQLTDECRALYGSRYRAFGARNVRRHRTHGVGATAAPIAVFVAKIEVGERRLDVLEFIEIARALNRDPAELLSQMLG